MVHLKRLAIERCIGVVRNPVAEDYEATAGAYGLVDYNVVVARRLARLPELQL